MSFCLASGKKNILKKIHFIICYFAKWTSAFVKFNYVPENLIFLTGFDINVDLIYVRPPRTFEKLFSLAFGEEGGGHFCEPEGGKPTVPFSLLRPKSNMRFSLALDRASYEQKLRYGSSACTFAPPFSYRSRYAEHACRNSMKPFLWENTHFCPTCSASRLAANVIYRSNARRIYVNQSPVDPSLRGEEHKTLYVACYEKKMYIKKYIKRKEKKSEREKERTSNYVSRSGEIEMNTQFSQKLELVSGYGVAQGGRVWRGKKNEPPVRRRDGRRRSFLHVRSIEIRLNYTGRNPLIEPAGRLSPPGLSCAGLRKADDNLRTDVLEWMVPPTRPFFSPFGFSSCFPGVVGETQGHPSSHGGRRDVHVGPEIRRVAFSSHGGLDATSEIPSATRFRHIRVSSVDDAAHRSLHAPLRRRLVDPRPARLSLSPRLTVLLVFQQGGRGGRADFARDAEIRAISICRRRKLNVRRTCIAIYHAAFAAPRAC